MAIMREIRFVLRDDVPAHHEIMNWIDTMPRDARGVRIAPVVELLLLDAARAAAARPGPRRTGRKRNGATEGRTPRRPARPTKADESVCAEDSVGRTDGKVAEQPTSTVSKDGADRTGDDDNKGFAEFVGGLKFD